MTPDRDSRKDAAIDGIMLIDRVWCERCGGFYSAGDWPWCKGNSEDHRR